MNWHPNGTQGLSFATDGTVDGSRRRGVRVREEMAIRGQGERRGAMAEPTADRQRIDAGRDQRTGMAVS
jgi:hypothetical protein